MRTAVPTISFAGPPAVMALTTRPASTGVATATPADTAESRMKRTSLLLCPAAKPPMRRRASRSTSGAGWRVKKRCATCRSFPVNLGGGTALSALAGSCAMQNRHGGVVRHGAPFLTRISRAGLTGTHGKSSPAQRQCVRAGLSLSGSPAPPRHVEVYDETRAMRFRTVRR